MQESKEKLYFVLPTEWIQNIMFQAQSNNLTSQLITKSKNFRFSIKSSNAISNLAIKNQFYKSLNAHTICLYKIEEETSKLDKTKITFTNNLNEVVISEALYKFKGKLNFIGVQEKDKKRFIGLLQGILEVYLYFDEEIPFKNVLQNFGEMKKDIYGFKKERKFKSKIVAMFDEHILRFIKKRVTNSNVLICLHFIDLFKDILKEESKIFLTKEGNFNFCCKEIEKIVHSNLDLYLFFLQLKLHFTIISNNPNHVINLLLKIFNHLNNGEQQLALSTFESTIVNDLVCNTFILQLEFYENVEDDILRIITVFLYNIIPRLMMQTKANDENDKTENLIAKFYLFFTNFNENPSRQINK